MAHGIAHHTASTTITMNDKRPAGRLLIVEDDPEMSTGLLLFLESQGFEVKLANDGDKGLEEAISLPGFDLLVLDAKLPSRGGFEILREVRNRGVSTPVLMLTGLGGHESKMRGFELGADDYLTKPFSTEELLVRVHAILRRSQPRPQDATGRFRVGGLDVNLETKEVTRNGERVDLTDLEFRLLKYLILHRGRTATREQILRDVWGLPSDIETRTIDRHVNALRKVMDGDSEETWAIRSVYGIGYKLVEAEPVQ